MPNGVVSILLTFVRVPERCLTGAWKTRGCGTSKWRTCHSKIEERSKQRRTAIVEHIDTTPWHPDGSCYLADGYGTGYIHRYSQDGRFLSTFGGKGGREQHGKFATPHGPWVDARPGREPQLCVCDRANARLEYFTLDGEYVSTVEGLSYPAHLDTRGDLLLCPDLHARVSLFGKDNQLIAHLGYDNNCTKDLVTPGCEQQQWQEQ
jgi:hypothetical protein